MKKTSIALFASCLLAAGALHANVIPETVSNPDSTTASTPVESDCTLTLSKGVFVVRVPERFTLDICPAPGRKISSIESIMLANDHRQGWLSSHTTMEFKDSPRAHWTVASREGPSKVNAIVRMDDGTITEIRFFQAPKSQNKVTVQRLRK